MKKQVTFSMFVDAFRCIRPDNFTYEGLEVLFDYFESYEDETGHEIELDVIAICCEYSECEKDSDEAEDVPYDAIIGETNTTIVYQSY